MKHTTTLVHCPLACLTLVFTCIALASCRAPEEVRTTTVERPAVVDPNYRLELAGWWSNGQELLRLESDGRYLLYDTPTRLEPPLHRGRWEQQTHARIKLEPYEELEMEPLSVEVRMVGDDRVLHLPGYTEFRRTTAPRRAPLRIEPPPLEPMSTTAAAALQEH